MAARLVTRALGRSDTEAALELYGILTLGPKPTRPETFHRVIEHHGTTVFGCCLGSELVAMVTLHILPNVTMHGRPYALIENVVTHDAHRNRGYGRLALKAAEEAAWAADTYKIMLLTGQKRNAKAFYEACGFSSEDKHGMVLRRA
ncbi:MAG: GNAT family N-acetyltransferase [Pseudomonadota bacterium]